MFNEKPKPGSSEQIEKLYATFFLEDFLQKAHADAAVRFKNTSNRSTCVPRDLCNSSYDKSPVKFNWLKRHETRCFFVVNFCWILLSAMCSPISTVGVPKNDGSFMSF